jgi:hypothetical protein
MQVDPAIFYLMVVSVGVAAIALAAQAVALLMMAKNIKQFRAQFEEVRPKAIQVLDSANETLVESRMQLTEITTKTNKILDTTVDQAERTDVFLTEAMERARVQLDRVELVLDDSISRVHETVMLLNNGVLRPVRQVSGIVTGIRTALDYFTRGGRPNVSQATSDEEMFI